MRAGEMRDRVTIQQNTPSTNSQGGRTASWSTLATVWALVAAVAGGGEGLQAEAVTASLRYDVTIRYRADVTPKMRLSWTPYGGSAKTLQIVNVAPMGRDRLLLTCTETA